MNCPNCNATTPGRYCPQCGHDCSQTVNNVDTLNSLCTQTTTDANTLKSLHSQKTKDADTLNLLYALRAGISYVDVKIDDFKNTKKSLEEKKNNLEVKIASIKKDIVDDENTIAYCADYDMNAHQQLETRRNELDRPNLDRKLTKAFERQEFIERNGPMDVGLPAGGIAAIICAIISFILLLVCEEGFFSSLLLAVLIGAGGGILTFIISVAIIFSLKYYLPKKTEEYDNLVNQYNATCDELKHYDNMRNIMATGKLYHAKQNLIEKEKNLLILQQEITEAETELKTKPYPHLEKANATFAALVKEFSFLIDERDWKNLDRVIFCFETFRADTIKEALQQTDQQLQAEMISKTICDKIISVGQKLEGTIIKCAAILSKQLEHLGEELKENNDLMREMSRQNAEFIANQNKMISAMELGNALRKKNNKMSEQIMDDIHQMRINDDIRFYRSLD